MKYFVKASQVYRGKWRVYYLRKFGWWLEPRLMGIGPNHKTKEAAEVACALLNLVEES